MYLQPGDYLHLHRPGPAGRQFAAGIQFLDHPALVFRNGNLYVRRHQLGKCASGRDETKDRSWKEFVLTLLCLCWNYLFICLLIIYLLIVYLLIIYLLIIYLLIYYLLIYYLLIYYLFIYKFIYLVFVYLFVYLFLYLLNNQVPLYVEQCTCRCLNVATSEIPNSVMFVRRCRTALYHSGTKVYPSGFLMSTNFGGLSVLLLFI